MTEQESSVPDTDTLAFVDEAGDGGFSRKLTSARDHKVALMCALLFPAERIEEFRSAFRPGYDRFVGALCRGGKPHITDAFAPGNEAWAAVAQSVRGEFCHLVRRLQIPVVYDARRLAVERKSFENMESIKSQAKAMSRSRVRIPEGPSQSRVEEELVIGLALKLDDFCDACKRHRVDLFFDEINEKLTKLYRSAMDRTGNISKSKHVVKGWDRETNSKTHGEISFQASASFPLDTQHLGDLYVAGKADPLILAADIVTNSLNDHLRRLPPDAFLNRPSSIAGWELECRVYGVRDNAIEDLI